ncbi:transposase-like zinc-binding domain-containing protein [Endozoicomonas ascidiicola]
MYCTFIYRALVDVICIHCRKSDDVVRNGKARSGLQRFLCCCCNRTF